MKISVKAGTSLESHENIIALQVKGEAPNLMGREIPEGALFTDIMALGDLTGSRGSCNLVYGRQGRRWFITGLGKSESLDARSWRAAGAAMRKSLKKAKVADAVLILPAGADVIELVCGFLLAAYRYDRFISTNGDREEKLDQLTILIPEGDDTAGLDVDIFHAGIHAEGTLAARDLLCAPGNLVTPQYIATEAVSYAEESNGRINTTCLGEEELAADNFNAMLAVGQGSAQESKLVIMEYAPLNGLTADKTVVLVGKGVTFDSGGISIKPSALMDEMKYDMGGAAAVMGIFHALRELDLPLRIVGLVACAENMPGGDAYRPGDIIVSRSGLSIEVKNTDAEGRLVMADALDYARKYNPDLLMDLATLTGACVVALAHECAGLMANEKGEAFIEALRESGDAVGERVWPLPMYEEYADLIKSDVADVKNSGGRYGGAITAGKFLQKFADHAPWIHLDIAGTAWTGKERDHVPKVGSGFGVRLLLEFLENLGK
jgi:leucyl aminopeptidase